ncbi:myeloid leukemia factor 1-like isoform X3 [Myxocyprinus asiaticus]|nr:myeloid leukemia factor 1-like isoform X3 [Myxocyprinus asiaticus]
MFNNLLTQFEEDPFFSDPFQVHHEHMRQMRRCFSDPFSHGFMPSITDGRQRGHRGHGGHREEGQPKMSTNLRNDRELDFFSNPFSMIDSMRNRMKEMHRNVENMASDSNSHSFSSSSVMTYSKVGNEPAKVFQASSQTRCAPGGIKETRKSLQDSESGLQKMSIAHHIQDRGHVIERKENKKTGERELNQDFQNMDESSMFCQRRRSHLMRSGRGNCPNSRFLLPCTVWRPRDIEQ